MGIYDRAYYRDERQGGLLGGSMVINLIVATSIVFIAQQFFPKVDNGQMDALGAKLGLSADFLSHPWQVYQFVTYGFVHAGVGHVFFNMLGLWFFGREVENIYGPREFLRIYLTLIVMSGLAWYLSILSAGGRGDLVGASGGVMGIMILFVCHYPRQTILVWGIIPVPAWMLGTLFFLMEVSATTQVAQGDNVAHVAHVAGAVLGFIYYRSGWNLGRIVPSRLVEMLRRPRLKVHQPDEEEPVPLSEQVDRILQKIHRDGEASLTSSERKTLEEASRRYQRRRQ